MCGDAKFSLSIRGEYNVGGQYFSINSDGTVPESLVWGHYFSPYYEGNIYSVGGNYFIIGKKIYQNSVNLYIAVFVEMYSDIQTYTHNIMQ